MYLLKSYLTKSQLSLFDWKPEKHEEQRTVHATIRHMQSGAVVQIQEHQRKTMVSMDAMVHEARRWKGAAMNADEDHGSDNKARLRHSRMTTKADLDSYLMRKFGIDESAARDVSNHLTQNNVTADRSAEPHEFAGEPWADAVINKRRTEAADKPTGAQTIVARMQHAKERFDEALMTMAGITKEQAQRVTQYYLDKKLATMDAAIGQVKVKHGGYLDKDVILAAVKETEFQVPKIEVPKRKPKSKPEPRPESEYRIAKDDEPESGTKGRFLIHDKEMRPVEIPNEHGEIEANWPTLLEANRALNRHKQTEHTLKKTGVKGEYDAVAKSFVHPVSLIKSRKLDGKINFSGLDISIETGRSRCREWKNPHDGTQGMSRMRLPYGYIKSTLGVDGDHYDVFVGPDHSAPNVYIVTTMKAPDFTEVDEQKAFLGVNSPEEAKAHFMASYSDPRFFGSMTEMPFDEFKEKALGTKDDPKLISGRLITEDEIREYYRDGVKKAFAAIGEDWSAYDTAEVFKGMKAELEHTDLTGGDLAKTAMIVVAHLKENPKYYTLMGQAGL